MLAWAQQANGAVIPYGPDIGNVPTPTVTSSVVAEVNDQLFPAVFFLILAMTCRRRISI